MKQHRKCAIYTIGHSNKTDSELIELLKKYKIKTVIDVRSKPYSRYNPQFNREALKNSFVRNDINYIWQGNNLGGLLGNENWNGGIKFLEEKSKLNNVVVMCSEANPNNCHRKSKIQPELERLEIDVKHIMWDGSILSEQRSML